MEDEQEGLIPSVPSINTVDGRQIKSAWKARIILLICALAIFVVAFVAGYFVEKNISRTEKSAKKTGRHPEKYHENILMQMKAGNIEKNLRYKV